MRNLYKTTCFLMLFLVLGCGQKIVVNNDVVKNQMTKDGVYYALPLTIITAEIPIKKIKHTEGKFKKCAGILENLLFFNSVEIRAVKNDSNKVSLNISEEAVISSYGIPDPESIFMIEVDGGFLKKQEMELKLTESGLLTDISATVQDQSFDFLVKTLEIGASITSTIINPTPKAIIQKEGKSLTDCQKLNNRIVALRSQREKTKQKLISINDSNINIDKINKILSAYDKEEERLLNYILGTNTIIEWNLKFHINPTVPNSLYLFNIYKDDCLDLNTYYSNIPIPSAFKNDPNICLTKSQKEYYFVNFSKPIIEDSNKKSFSEKVEENKFKNINNQNLQTSGLRYRIPAIKDVTIIKCNTKSIGKCGNSKTIIASNILQIAQLGTIVALPASTGTGKTHYKVKFYTDTGTLEAIETNSETLNPESLDRIGDSILGVIQARDAKKESEKEPTSIEEKTEILNELMLDLQIEQANQALDDIKKNKLLVNP